VSTSRRVVVPQQHPERGPRDDQAVVRFRNPVDAAGDTSAPNVVLEDSRLSAQVRFTYVVLRKLAYERQGQPIYRRDIARHTGVSVRQIARHLAELEAARLVQVDSGQRDGLPNCYWIEDLAVRYGDLGAPRPRRHPAGGGGRGDRHGSARPPQDTRVPPPGDSNDPPPGTPTSSSSNAAVVDDDAQPQHLPGELAMADCLIGIGVDASVAASLVAVHAPEVIAAVLRVLERRRPRPRDPAAWAVAAIRRGWVVPEARQAAAGGHRAPPPAAPRADEAAIVAFERRADALLAALAPEDFQALQQQATQTVQERFDRRTAGSTVGAGLIRTELRRLAAVRGNFLVPGTPPAPGGPGSSSSAGGG